MTAALLAFILLPRIPLLEKGDLATRSITAPYTLIVESPASDQTATSFTVNKGELIVESGHRVTDRAARILGEIGRREGISNRLHAYAGLAGLVLIIFYLFYRDIRRYRPALIAGHEENPSARIPALADDRRLRSGETGFLFAR